MTSFVGTKQINGQREQRFSAAQKSTETTLQVMGGRGRSKASVSDPLEVWYGPSSDVVSSVPAGAAGGFGRQGGKLRNGRL